MMKKNHILLRILPVCRVTLVLIGPPLPPPHPPPPPPHRGRSSCAPPTTTSGTPSSRSACPLPHPPAPSSTASRPAWAAEDGRYHSCFGCQSYVDCRNGLDREVPCLDGQEFNAHSGECELQRSPTCVRPIRRTIDFMLR